MVVIPARNEERVIARAVKSFPHDTVIVVDDHSEDATAEVAHKAGAGVLPTPDLPAQALGKATSIAAGSRVLRSKWVLFADADTWYDEGFLNAAVDCAEASGLALLSIYLHPECKSFSESVLVPMATALYFAGVSPSSDPTGLFNGQCILARREAYDFIGGHTAVATNLIEDVKLAALARRHRLKFATARADHLGHIQFHHDGLWDGFERNAFRFMMVSPWIGATILIATFIAALWLPVLAWLIYEHKWIVAGAFGLMPTIVLSVWYGNPLRALLAPFGIYGMFFVILNGFIAALTGRQLVWKGRAL
jgi:glycosyltransferase involved in cell wall biosynthesis